MVRCSVVFENSEKLIDGIKTFRNLVSKKKCGCIAEILRIKNGFKDFVNVNNTNNKNIDLI